MDGGSPGNVPGGPFSLKHRTLGIVMNEINVELPAGQLTEDELESLLDGRDGSSVDEAAADAAACAAETELINPVTGAIVDTGDIDSLILACEECRRILDDTNAFYRTLREIAWSKTEGTTKTRRLRGKRYQAKVVQGDVYPVGAILKEAWNSYPQFREKYLRISRVDPQMREVAKLRSMSSDDPAFVQFKKMIEDAITKGTEGLPTVSMEEGGEK